MDHMSTLHAQLIRGLDVKETILVNKMSLLQERDQGNLNMSIHPTELPLVLQLCRQGHIYNLLKYVMQRCNSCPAM